MIGYETYRKLQNTLCCHVHRISLSLFATTLSFFVTNEGHHVMKTEVVEAED